MSCNSWREKVEAYADGELSSSESVEMASHLRQCPACTAAALEKVQIKRLIGAAGKRYTPSAELRANVLRSISKSRPREREWVWKLILIPAVLVLLFSVAVNLYVSRAKAGRARVYSELIDLHVSALASSSPADVLSTDRHTVKPWFEGKVPFSFNLPELQGSEFTLLGGRVTYLGQTSGAHLIYKFRKHEISVFIFPDRGEAGTGSSAPVQQFSFQVENWSRNGLRYFVIGDVSADEIDSLGKLFRQAG